MLTVGALSFTREISTVLFSRVAEVLAIVVEATPQSFSADATRLMIKPLSPFHQAGQPHGTPIKLASCVPEH